MNPRRRYSFFRKGGEKMNEISVDSEALREAYNLQQEIYVFDGEDEPSSVEDAQLFLLA